MARLPQPGSDDGQWGSILNTYLTISHNADGTLKDGVIGATKLAASSPTTGQVLGYDGTKLAWTAPAAGGSASGPATAATLGTIQLAGALGGTAAAPTVPGLATKADTSSVVLLSGNQTITGGKDFTGPLQAGGKAVVVTDDARLTNTRTPADGSVSATKLSAGPGSDGQVLSYDSGNLVWTTATASGSISDAAPGVKGIIALSGDLAGTAGTPTVPGLAAKADNNTVVHLATPETITGVKTFTASPVVPAPATAMQAATKKYVDDTVAAAGGAVTSVAGRTGVVTLTKADVGLANVDNTTDANKPVSTATQTALTGKAAAVHTHAAADIATGTVAPARLGAGTPSGTTFLRGDGQWAAPAAAGGNGYSFTVRRTSANVTANAFDMFFVDNTSAGSVTITLPAPTLNATVRVKRLAATADGVSQNGLEVAAPAGSYIDSSVGVGTHTLNNRFDSQDFWSDGSNWYRV